MRSYLKNGMWEVRRDAQTCPKNSFRSYVHSHVPTITWFDHARSTVDNIGHLPIVTLTI